VRTPAAGGGGGGPWDLEQTFKTIAPLNTIEEPTRSPTPSRRGSPRRSRAGDLLRRWSITARMVRRKARRFRRAPQSPPDEHGPPATVFGTEAARAAGAAPGFWERIKAKEKGPTAAKTRVATSSFALTALMRAVQLQDTARAFGSMRRARSGRQGQGGATPNLEQAVARRPHAGSEGYRPGEMSEGVAIAPCRQAAVT